MIQQSDLIQSVSKGNYREIAKCLSIVENNEGDWSGMLKAFTYNHNIPIIGITGPPGAGKSTLISALLKQFAEKSKVAVLAIDPTSPFTKGSLLGDRVRMVSSFNNQNIFIRSVATRGALGGLSAKTLEMTDVLRASEFDIIFVETVGVGQSEVEIAALADTTVVVLVPESGDEVQMIKSGIIEIADIVVVNKADRHEAKKFKATVIENLRHHKEQEWIIPVIETIAIKEEGISTLIENINAHNKLSGKKYKANLLAQRLYHYISHLKMKDVLLDSLVNEIDTELKNNSINIYKMAEKHL
jgi:LAO/AO transport system kinase